MLHSRLRPLPRPLIPVADAHSFSDEDSEAPEDHFGTFLAHLFPEDVPSFHGVPGERLLYSSSRYGDLDIMVPPYPEKSDGSHTLEEGRQLQAHILWSSGLIIAENVESADGPNSALADAETESEGSRLNTEIWSARGQTVLELGAGAALPSLICALSNASSITITDHPSSPALLGAINYNLTHNLQSRKRESQSQGPQISIHPHQWGLLSDSFAMENKARFTRIIAADCHWMLWQHHNLCQSLQWFLAPGGKVWMTASFHTGRPVVVSFFETAKKYGLVVECIWDKDLIGGTRDWVPVREDEGPENRKRWCVVAVMKRENE